MREFRVFLRVAHSPDPRLAPNGKGAEGPPLAALIERARRLRG